jgi:hypothetical protein
MKKTSFLTLAAMAILVSGCDVIGIGGNGNIVTDQRTIGEISQIYSRGAFKIEWRNGPPALSITTDENLLRYIESNKVDNHLELRTHERVRPTHGIKVVVTSPTRVGAKLSGASDLKVQGLSQPKFVVQGTGASDVTLDGTVDELLADLTGASDLRAKGLQTKSAEISATGASDVSISVSETLRVSITGAGDVKYYGNPKTIEKHVTGAGSIKHKD